MQAVILAGGLGTRLRGLVEGIPKPMIEIAGRPFLEYLLLQVAAYGIRDVVLCLGHLAHVVRSYFGRGRQFGVSISYSEEPKRLGTGGALKYAESLVKGNDFLVMNADSFLEVDLDRLVGFHRTKRALVAIALARVSDASRFGRVCIDDQLQIKSFVEKGAQGESFINGGVYVFDKRIFSYLSPGYSSLEKDVFPQLIGRGIFGFPTNGYFVDIGTPESLNGLLGDPKEFLAAFNRQIGREVRPGC